MALIDRKDAALDFGSFTLASSSAFENSLNIGASDISGFGVNFALTTAASGGTSWTPKLQGSTDGSTWVDIVTGKAITDTTAGAGVTLTFPRDTDYQYVRPNVTVSGTYTAGVVSAAVETYRG